MTRAISAAGAVRRILTALAALPGGPDPALCQRTDAVCTALNAAGEETNVEKLLQRLELAAGLVSASPCVRYAVHTDVDARTRASRGSGTQEENRPELLGIIEVRPETAAGD